MSLSFPERTSAFARIVDFVSRPGQNKNTQRNLSCSLGLSMRSYWSPMFSQSCFDLSFWKTREQAERYNRDIAGGQRGAAALLEADPVVKTFNVTSSPTHNIAAGRAA